MSELLSSITGGGGGGGFTTRFASTTTDIASGSSGTLVTLTPPAGQKVRLTSLVAGANDETNMAVNINSVEVISGTLDESVGTTNAGNFSIGRYLDGSQLYIQGGVDEDIDIIKTTSTTSQTLEYTYQFGE